MTIAACHLSPEGVVLGADSAITFGVRNHFLYGQKVYEVGKPGQATPGLCFWGLGSMGNLSYRTLIGRLSDEVGADPSLNVEGVASRWRQLFWEAYLVEFQDVVKRVDQLAVKDSRTNDEQEELLNLIANHSGGFCLGGYAPNDRVPRAFSVTYRPDEVAAPSLGEVTYGSPQFWGQPNLLTSQSID